MWDGSPCGGMARHERAWRLAFCETPGESNSAEGGTRTFMGLREQIAALWRMILTAGKRRVFQRPRRTSDEL
jgi:hypothetical protein